MNFIKKLFSRNKEIKVRRIDDYSSLLNINKIKPKKNEELTVFNKNGYEFKIGDKVITKSNECVNFKIGIITSIITLGGSNTIVPTITTLDGEIYTTMGVIRHYNDKLENLLNTLKPLEQWNHVVPKEVRYTKKEMLLKELKHNSIKKIQ